jgi:hypothetical protein
MRQPVVVIRLEEIVHRIDLERLHGMVTVCGHEDDARGPLRVERPEQAESVDPGHLHIQKHQLRLLPLDRLRRLVGILALADDLDVRMLGEHGAQPEPRQRLVIHDQDPHRSSPHAQLDELAFQTIAATWIRGVSVVWVEAETSWPCFFRSGGT